MLSSIIVGLVISEGKQIANESNWIDKLWLSYPWIKSIKWSHLIISIKMNTVNAFIAVVFHVCLIALNTTHQLYESMTFIKSETRKTVLILLSYPSITVLFYQINRCYSCSRWSFYKKMFLDVNYLPLDYTVVASIHQINRKLGMM